MEDPNLLVQLIYMFLVEKTVCPYLYCVTSTPHDDRHGLAFRYDRTDDI